MANALKEKVIKALKEAVGEDADIEIDDAGGDRVQGVVLSRFFANQSGNERQDHIWKYLDAQLSQSERTRIVFIVTDTPEEYDALKVDVG